MQTYLLKVEFQTSQTVVRLISFFRRIHSMNRRQNAAVLNVLSSLITSTLVSARHIDSSTSIQNELSSIIAFSGGGGIRGIVLMMQFRISRRGRRTGREWRKNFAAMPHELVVLDRPGTTSCHVRPRRGSRRFVPETERSGLSRGRDESVRVIGATESRTKKGNGGWTPPPPVSWHVRTSSQRTPSSRVAPGSIVPYRFLRLLYKITAVTSAVAWRT